jgi:hypothetical protein
VPKRGEVWQVDFGITQKVRPAMSKKAIAAVVVLIGIFVGIINLTPKLSDVERHKAALLKLQFPPPITRVSDYFSRSYLLWNLQGRPTPRQALDRHDRHVESLIALGYLQRRTFRLNQKLDTASWGSFQTVLVRAQVAGWRPDPLAECRCERDEHSMTVVGPPKEMRSWEQLIRAFDSTNSPPNKSPPRAAGAGPCIMTGVGAA